MQNTPSKMLTWYLDSDCGKHITGDKANLINYQASTTVSKIKFAGGKEFSLTGMGYNLV